MYYICIRHLKNMIFLNFSVMDFNFQTEIKYIDSDTVSCSGDGSQRISSVNLS